MRDGVVDAVAKAAHANADVALGELLRKCHDPDLGVRLVYVRALTAVLASGIDTRNIAGTSAENVHRQLIDVREARLAV